MHSFIDLADPEIARLLKDGAVGVIPTDTVYGIVARAYNPAAIKRMYSIRRRDPHKACIMLIGSRDQITDTDAWQPVDWHVTKRYWPGPVSIVVPMTNKTPPYLYYGAKAPSYRVPDLPKLRVLLNRVGPLLAPTANMQGEPPATTIEEAKAYFGDKVDFYVDGGHLRGVPSTLITTEGGKVTILRQGAGMIDPSDL